jgi:hypothetical protein
MLEAKTMAMGDRRGHRAAALLLALPLALALAACARPAAPPPPDGTMALPPVARLAVTEAAMARAVLDIGAVPGLTEAGRQSYARFLTYPAPRAFALGAEGGLAWAANARSTEEAERRALTQCQAANGGAPCRLYARDQQVVWTGPAGDEPAPLTLRGDGWTLTRPAGFLQHGEETQGALLWTHGRGADPQRPPAAEPSPMPLPFVQRFNNAGWDVWVLERDAARDVNYDTVLSFADAALRVAAATLRAAGYGRVVAAGQSAGGWAALAALDTPGLLDGAIAIAGAGLYQPPAGQLGTLDFGALLGRVRDREAPVVIAAFEGDRLLPAPAASAAMIRAALGGRAAPLLLIDRPEGLVGHGAGAEPAFNDRFGACILRAVALRDPGSC